MKQKTRQRAAPAPQPGAPSGQTLFALPVPFFTQDASGRFGACNKAFAGFFGVSPEAVAGREPSAVFGARLGAAFDAHNGELARSLGVRAYEVVFTVPGAGPRFAIVVKAAHAGPDAKPGFAGVVMENTPLRAAEESLRQAREAFAAILRHAPGALWAAQHHAGTGARIVFANPMFEALWDLSAQDIARGPRALWRAVHPEDRRRMVRAFAGEKYARGGELNEHLRIVRKDGSVRWLRVRAQPAGQAGDGLRSVGVAEDVTALALAQSEKLQALQERDVSGRRLAAIFNSLPDAIMTVDRSMRLIEANRAMLKLAGRQGFGLETGRLMERGGSKTLAQCLKILHRTLERLTPVQHFVADCTEAGAQACTLELSTSVLLDHAGEFAGAVLTARDVTALTHIGRRLQKGGRYPGILGESPAIRHVLLQLDELCEVDSTVLILGETGTGKELVAEALHAGSRRAAKPLIKVNCSALSPHLVESELFGHVKGAFTGAVRESAGRVQKAQGGTLFLDEIGDLELAVQVKLLRLLEQREFERVGDSRTLRADVRFLAATHADLLHKMRAGLFREDLFHRLNVVTLHMPALRDREDDAVLLGAHFLKACRKAQNKPPVELAPETADLLRRYLWPGNIRELKNAMEHASIRCRQALLFPEDLPPALRHPGGADALPALERAGPQPVDREALAAALKLCGGNKQAAARHLGLERTRFYRLLKAHGLA